MPFRYNGNLFETCQPYPGITEYWCATTVDNDLEFLNGPNNWGICDQACPIPTSDIASKTSLPSETIDSPKGTIEFQSKDVAWQCKF